MNALSFTHYHPLLTPYPSPNKLQKVSELMLLD